MPVATPEYTRWLTELQRSVGCGHLPQRSVEALTRRHHQETAMPRISPDEVLTVLSRHVGSENGVHIGALTREVTHQAADAHTERAVRNAIVELRRAGHHVCAHPKSGYYLAATAEELERTCLWLYDRALCSLEQISAMRGVSLPDLRGQLRLPT